MLNRKDREYLKAMDSAAEMLSVDIKLRNNANNEIEHAKKNLNKLNISMDDSLSAQKALLQELELSLNEPTSANNNDLLAKFNDLTNVNEPILEKLTLIETPELSFDWQEAVAINDAYAKDHDIDLSHPFVSMFSDVEFVEISQQMVEKFELLTLDKEDYAFAASAGVIAGLIDAIFIGTIKTGTDATGLQKIVDDGFSKMVKAYGKIERITDLKNQEKRATTEEAKNRIRKKIADVSEGIVTVAKDGQKTTRKWETADSTKWLEKLHPVNYDAATNKVRGGNLNVGLRPDNHHLLSLAHEPSLLGLLVGIIDQITGKTTFRDVKGDIQRVVTDNINKDLGSNPIEQIIKATENWFGHTMSDIAGSSTSKGRGSGLPVPGWSALQKLQFGHIKVSERKQDMTIAQVSEWMFKQGYDVRAFTAQLIPILIYETLIRSYWFYKQHFFYGKEIKESLPIANNRELARLLLISAASFSAVDVAHATIKSGPGSPQFIGVFLMTVNYPGLIDLGFRSVQNIRNEVQHKKHVEDIYEKEILVEYKRVLNEDSLF
ncbi:MULTISPECIES: hypothetical protein [Lactobacillales]|uniref:hypothetical protein n=1 Tax=Lactobacillales TaxID=186826 RepID=UPI00068DBD25|nr:MULTISPECIES: hypothetical protein [Lactobacillales]